MPKFNVNVSLKLVTRCFVAVDDVEEFVDKLQTCGLYTYIDSDDDYECEGNVSIMIFKLTK